MHDYGSESPPENILQKIHDYIGLIVLQKIFKKIAYRIFSKYLPTQLGPANVLQKKTHIKLWQSIEKRYPENIIIHRKYSKKKKIHENGSDTKNIKKNPTLSLGST